MLLLEKPQMALARVRPLISAALALILGLLGRDKGGTVKTVVCPTLLFYKTQREETSAPKPHDEVRSGPRILFSELICSRTISFHVKEP